MLYTIVEPFSPVDGARWTSYCEWRGLAFERFDSIDGILRPNLFKTPHDSDWEHIVNEDNMLHFITDLSYATHKHAQIGNGELVGVRFDDHDIADPGFLGFDIIDGYCDISLLTNWGNDMAIINRALAPNALLRDIKTAEEIFAALQTTCADDSHVPDSRIVSVYNPKAIRAARSHG